MGIYKSEYQLRRFRANGHLATFVLVGTVLAFPQNWVEDVYLRPTHELRDMQVVGYRMPAIR